MEDRPVRIAFAVLVAIGVVFGLGAVLTDFSSVSLVYDAPALVKAGAARSAAGAGAAGLAEAARPTDQPAPMGAVLSVLDEPPPDTVVSFPLDAAAAGSIYDVAFAPYGFAAGGDRTGSPDRLVIKVLSATAPSQDASAAPWSGANLLARLGPKMAGGITKGGLYVGSIQMVRSGDVLEPVVVVAYVPKKR